MGPLSSADEEVLLAAVKEASALCDDLHPTAAVAKVAGARGLRPGEIRLVANALNNGRQTAQTAANVSALDKFAHFPLVDADEAVRLVYGRDHKAPVGETKAAAVAPALFEKAAECSRRLQPGPPARVPARDPLVELRRLEKLAEEASRRCSAARDKVAAALDALDGYFGVAPAHRMSFADFDAATRAYMGPAARAAVDLLAARRPGEKRADDSLRTSGPVDLKAPPFALLRAAVAASSLFHLAGREKAAADAAVADYERGPAAAYVACFRPQEKDAGAVTTALSATGIKSLFDTLTDRLRPAGPRTPVEMALAAKAEMDDPAHESALRRIRARAMFSSFLGDREDPIAGHSPEEVAQAYNELVQVAPRAGELPAVMGPLLRKRLGGRLEPFEVRELTDIERGLRDTRPGIDVPRTAPVPSATPAK